MGTTTMTNATLFRSMDVWKRADNGRLMRYRILEMLRESKFYVQNLDFFDTTMGMQELQEASLEFEFRFLDLLGDMPPDERTSGFDTIEEAIKDHDESFS